MQTLETLKYSQAPEPYEAARLRGAGFKDLDNLVDLYNKARDNHLEKIYTMQVWLEQGGALVLENAQGDMLCAIRWREDGAGWLVDRVATHPSARSQGYGRWLMTKLEALAIRTNIPTLTLSLNEVRDDLLHYYQRMGYQIKSQHPNEVILAKRVGGVWQYK